MTEKTVGQRLIELQSLGNLYQQQIRLATIAAYHKDQPPEVLNNFDSSLPPLTAYAIIRMIEFSIAQREWDILGHLAKSYAQELREAIQLEYPESEPFLRPICNLPFHTIRQKLTNEHHSLN